MGRRTLNNVFVDPTGMVDYSSVVLLNKANNNIPRRSGGMGDYATYPTSATALDTDEWVGRLETQIKTRRVKTGGVTSVPEEFLCSGRCIGDDESLGKHLVGKNGGGEVSHISSGGVSENTIPNPSLKHAKTISLTQHQLTNIKLNRIRNHRHKTLETNEL